MNLSLLFEYLTNESQFQPSLPNSSKGIQSSMRSTRSDCKGRITVQVDPRWLVPQETIDCRTPAEPLAPTFTSDRECLRERVTHRGQSYCRLAEKACGTLEGMNNSSTKSSCTWSTVWNCQLYFGDFRAVSWSGNTAGHSTMSLRVRTACDTYDEQDR